MRFSTTTLRFAVAAAALSGIAGVTLSAQTFSASTGTDAGASTTSEQSAQRPAAVRHRKAEDSLIFGTVRSGVYTVDGMVAKVQLNYDVNGANYLYMFVPGVGTAVVSAAADPNAVVAEATLREDQLSFTVGEHHFNLTGVTLMNSKGGVPDHLYVRLDRSAWRLNRQPMVGFGKVAELPYAWPGALPPTQASVEESRVVPPVPANLLPSTTAVTPSAGKVTPVSVDPSTLRSVTVQ